VGRHVPAAPGLQPPQDGGLQFFAQFLFELRRGQVLQAAVGTYLVVVITPGFDQDSRLPIFVNRSRLEQLDRRHLQHLFRFLDCAGHPGRLRIDYRLDRTPSSAQGVQVG
jgi:hypothetical protein